MQRTKNQPSTLNIYEVMDLLFKQEDGVDAFVLYMFYQRCGYRQYTTMPMASIEYVSKGIGITIQRCRRGKKILIETNLIEEVIGQSRVKLVYNSPIPLFGEGCGELNNAPLPLFDSQIIKRKNPKKEKESIETLISITSSKDILPSSLPITKGMFDQFWKIYPKKVDKGAVLTRWNKLCSIPPNQRPTWRQIRLAIINQKKSERWQDPKFIPNGTTWLNQQRWLDDAAEMKCYMDAKTPQFKVGPAGTYKRADDGFYYHIKNGSKYYE